MFKLTEKAKRRLINNALDRCKNAQSNWAKNFWFNVWKKLVQKYGTRREYELNLH